MAKRLTEDMELEQIKRQLADTNQRVMETNQMVRDIKFAIVGNKELDTPGLRDEFDELRGWLGTLKDQLVDITGKVQHIFIWRDKWVEGRRERSKEILNKWTYVFAAVGASGTLVGIVIGLKELFGK